MQRLSFLVLALVLAWGCGAADWVCVNVKWKPGVTGSVVETNGGCRVRLDRRELVNSRTPWFGLAPAAGREVSFSPNAELVFTCRYPEKGIVKSIASMRVVDADGEIFRFSPRSVKRIGECVVAEYKVADFGWAGAFFASRPRKGATEGKNRNDRLDPPLKLMSVAFGLDSDCEEGELEFESLDVTDVAKTASILVREPVLDFEPGGDRFVTWSGREVAYENGKLHVTADKHAEYIRLARFPGMKPFPACQDIVLRTSRAYDGTVELRLKDPMTGTQSSVVRPWQAETHFVTNITGRWQLEGMRFFARPEKGCPAPKLDFLVESLEGVYLTTGAGACRLDVETGNDLHLVRSDRERPVLTLCNVSATNLHWKGILRCRDFFDDGWDELVDREIGPGETMRIPVNRLLKKGIWRIYGEIAASDGSKARQETRFAVLDPHEVTPRMKRGAFFRPGINWHASRFSDNDRRRCEEALVACGCKLVRAGGYHFQSVERREGVLDWKFPDQLMHETKALGISLVAGAYSPPRWSQDTNRIARCRHFKRQMVPSRPGVFEKYAEQLARRYGDDIDYYELGNEWDLVPESIMTRDEAVRIHREGFDGIRRGCSTACVMPNGWTGPDVRHDHYSKDPEDRVGGDYQAYVMERIKDQCDIYPTHMHGRFRDYRRKLKKFFELRRRIGCESLPWFASETAYSTVNGEEDNAARYVFQKIMYSWANGSVDYIWYNLRATGWVENDPEQGYGLVTADFHPRATYAAFSALTAVYLGLKFEETVFDRASRLVFRFSDAQAGAHKIVLGGWDAVVGKECVVRVRTDAAQAFAVDLMGNRTALASEGGVVAWALSSDPGSLVLEGATFATPDADDLAAVPTSANAVIRVPQGRMESRTCDVRLDTADRMTDFHQAIPATAYRVWKGPQDLSAEVWFERTGNDVKVRVKVTDDVHAAGDRVELTVLVPGRSPKTEEIPLRSAEGNVRVHELLMDNASFGFDSSVLREGVSVNLRVYEDDGEGPDGYLMLSDEGETLKKVIFPDISL